MATETVYTCRCPVELERNISHLETAQGDIACLPVLAIGLYSKLDVPLGWFLIFRGNSFLNLLRWFFGASVTNDEYAEYQHLTYERQGICHKWKGITYIYHGN